MSLDDAYCADGCGRLAETERPATGELVCRGCHAATIAAWMEDAADNHLTWSDL